MKDEVAKQIEANVVRLTNYPTQLENIMPVQKKDKKIIICLESWDLNKASPKTDSSVPIIHTIIDYYAKHQLHLFVNYFKGYYLILKNKDDAQKLAFITPWVVYCYRVITFGLKNIRATYKRAMTTLYHDMIHKEIKVYLDDVVIKSKKSLYHLDL